MDRSDEKRIVDSERARLSPEDHAVRALDRFFGPHAEEIETAKFGGGSYGGKEYTGDDMRAAVRNLFFNLDISIPLEVAQFLGQLEAQHRSFLETLAFANILQGDGKPREGDIPPPSFEAVKKAFTFAELEAARTFEQPTLILMPEGLSFADLGHAIDAHKSLPGQLDALVKGKDVFGLNVGKGEDAGEEDRKIITGYRAVIVEGATNMSVKEGDDVNATLGERVRARKAKRGETPGLKGMDRTKMALLMLHAYRKGEKLDGRTFMMLDDDPALSASHVPCALLDGRGGKCRPSFCASPPEVRDDWGRFRSSVGGNVLLS